MKAEMSVSIEGGISGLYSMISVCGCICACVRACVCV